MQPKTETFCVRVEAASRLHFGLLNCSRMESGPGRMFGSVGMMVANPGTTIVARKAPCWSARGSLADRAMTCAKTVVEHLSPDEDVPLEIHVLKTPPAHVGLGTGTQLSLAAARAAGCLAGGANVETQELASWIGRGARSALGIHGFHVGGFLVEGGKIRLDQISPLVARMEFPESWRVILVLPPCGPGLHGSAENQVFQNLAGLAANSTNTDALCRLVLLGMLPAMADRDLTAFGEAVHEFNRRAGELFALAQGGIYSNSKVTDAINFIRGLGIEGVGQSSWGPAIFAFVDDEDRGKDAVLRIRSHFSLEVKDVFVTKAWNHGAVVEETCSGCS